MELTKLIEKVSKGELHNGDKIKITGSKIIITYRCDLYKRWFEKDGRRIDIIDYIGCDFKPPKKSKNESLDIWDEFDKSLNPDDDWRQMIRNASVSTVLTDEISPEIAKIFLSSASDIQKSNDGYEFILGNNNSGKYILDNAGELKFTPFTQEEMLDYTRESYFPTHRFNVAQGCFNAAVTLMDDYKKEDMKFIILEMLIKEIFLLVIIVMP